MKPRTHRPLPAVRLAATFAAIYLAVCLVYIAVSGRIAASLAGSIGELETIERVKGFAFVVLTSLLIFVMAWRGLRRIADQEAEIARKREALVDADRRAVTSLLAASVAHDMNNLLQTGLTGAEELLENTELDAAGRGAAERLNRALDGLTTLAGRLVVVGRERRPGQVAPLDLGSWLDGVVALASSHPKVRAVRLTTRRDGDLRILANEGSLQHAVLNLLINAADAAGAGGRVEARALRVGSEIALEVHDDGPGVAVDDRARIFESFFTTKADGTGVGLLSVEACAGELGGSVEVETSDLGGACFRMRLPVR